MIMSSFSFWSRSSRIRRQLMNLSASSSTRPRQARDSYLSKPTGSKSNLYLKKYFLTCLCRMTKEAIKMFKEGDFTPDAVKDLHISYETMFTQVPIVIKNSHLMNALMLEMQESLTLDVGGTQFLDLGTAHTLETELRAMMDAVDELNQESIKFNKHQNMVLKQYQEKTRWIQKRQLENQARSTRGEVRLFFLKGF